MMTIKDTLIAARALLAEGPHRWTQGVLGRNAAGYACSPADPEEAAVCFCAYGAIIKACADNSTEVMLSFLRANGISGSIGPWNDDPGRTYEGVLAAFDRAIEVQP